MCNNVDQFRILFGKIKLLDKTQDLFRQIQNLCDHRIFCTIFPNTLYQFPLDQKLQLVKYKFLHFLPKKMIRISGMILYFIPQKLSVFIKFYGKGFHWTGGSWFNARSTFHNNGILCDQCCYGFPVLRNTSILHS